MEFLELFTKAIAPQIFGRLFENIPSFIVFFGFFVLFVLKYLLKWNKDRFSEIGQQNKEILTKVNNLELEIKQDRENSIKQFKEIDNKVNDLTSRVVKIETRDEINSKQENTIMIMLNRIFNSIEKK